MKNLEDMTDDELDGLRCDLEHDLEIETSYKYRDAELMLQRIEIELLWRQGFGR